MVFACDSLMYARKYGKDLEREVAERCGRASNTCAGVGQIRGVSTAYFPRLGG